MLVRPANFGANLQTKESNSFQKEIEGLSAARIKEKALAEFDNFARVLQERGVNVYVFEDTDSPVKPDAVFPNNWVTFHSDGKVLLYPMQVENRMQERRLDIIDALKKKFKIDHIVDLYVHKNKGRCLEGTGSIIFDHDAKIAFACLSPRTDKLLFTDTCDYLGYQAVYFHAADRQGEAIYHTNVMMCIAEKFAVICSESIRNEAEKKLVLDTLTGAGHEVVDISFEQMSCFAGNMISLQIRDDRILVMSQTAFDSLTVAQKAQIEKYCELFPIAIPTIETIGGGSARCMIAEIFLSPDAS